jgi:hypothetical protein
MTRTVILYFTSWTIRLNETIIIQSILTFCVDFMIRPMLTLSYDKFINKFLEHFNLYSRYFLRQFICNGRYFIVAAFCANGLLFTLFLLHAFFLEFEVSEILYGFIVFPALIVY